MKKKYAKFMIMYWYGWIRLEIYTIGLTLMQFGKVIIFMYGKYRQTLKKNYYRMLATEYGMTERDIRET